MEFFVTMRLRRVDSLLQIDFIEVVAKSFSHYMQEFDKQIVTSFRPSSIVARRVEVVVISFPGIKYVLFAFRPEIATNEHPSIECDVYHIQRLDVSL